ncbi:MAG TPA: hypothetical protein VGD80_38360, partial [Kofleriaceae bacterium]
LWQRALAVLRRPPALAFATVVVLVGGAVLFIGRGKGMHADLAAGSSGAMKPIAQPAEPIARDAVSAPAKIEPPASTEKAVEATELEQLYKQCVTAARRGDCEAVRKMVGRIAKTDRDYRARVANEKAVVACLGAD